MKTGTKQDTQFSHAGFSGPAEETRWWQTTRARMAGLGISAVALICIFIWLFMFHPYVSTDDARIDADMIRVVNQGFSQKIMAVHVKEGDHVRKGRVLVELDHRMAEAQLDKARAKSRVMAIERRRAEALASSGGLSQSQLDRVRAEAQAASADERLAEIALQYTTITAPVDGIVVQKLAKTGNLLEMNQAALTIVDIENAWVSANIEETEVRLVKPKQKVSISVDEGGALTGTVVDVRRAAAGQFALIPTDNAAGNFVKLVQRIPVKVALDPHPAQELRVGQSVEIKIRVR